jgi:3-deoxy-7-phosphoheptulonate synthase
MVVVMKAGADRQQVEHVVSLVRGYGLEDRVIEGVEHTVVACIGDIRRMDTAAIERAPMVDRVVPISAPYKMASLEVRAEPTQVRIGPAGFPIGGRAVGVIAGPCAVEGLEQLLRIAEAARDAGCIGLRGGAYKPRTSPYSFQGHGIEGLRMLAEARDRTGLAVVTEVIGIESLGPVAEYADVLQIGARNMQHYPLLEAVGRLDKPVLLKRGPSATLEELLLAAEYILNAGNGRVILCERGIRTFEKHTRNTLALAAVPALKEASHLPVVVDPSHGTGHARLVPAMCRAAIAAGADGLLVECHGDPARAMSDGAQSLTPAALAAEVAVLRQIARAVGRDL